MTLRNYGRRSSALLRLAPWADLEALREDLAQGLLEELAENPEDYSTIAKNRILSFAAGERPIVSNCAKFRVILNNAIYHRYNTHQRRDPLYAQAREELQNYFLVTDRKLGLGT